MSYHVSYLKSPLTCQVHVRVSLKMLCQVALGTREYGHEKKKELVCRVCVEQSHKLAAECLGSIRNYLKERCPYFESFCYHAQARKLLHVHVCVHTYRVFSQSTFFFLMQ